MQDAFVSTEQEQLLKALQTDTKKLSAVFVSLPYLSDSVDKWKASFHVEGSSSAHNDCAHEKTSLIDMFWLKNLSVGAFSA